MENHNCRLNKCRCIDHIVICAGKAATAIKAAANKTATAVISGSPENSQLHPAGQSAASSSPAQKARLPTAPQAAPSSPAPRALQPTASRGLWSPAQKAPLPTVPQASSSSPAPRALQPTASRPLSSPAQNASQAASPGLPVPQSSLTRCASQTTPLRPQRPVRDLTNSIEGARGVAAEVQPQSKCFGSHTNIAALMTHLAIRTACVSSTSPCSQLVL